jgi:hypothetical protein
MFDNSGNHHKRAPGALCADDRNLSDGGKMGVQRDTTWGDGHFQSMVLPDGRPKGLVRILTERNAWPPQGMPLKQARATLAEFPDFKNQREWLRETVEDAGHSIDYYPKFHCELNYIEMVWAYSKKKLRRTCTYNYHDLCRELPEALHDVPVEFHRRALRHCFRFMSGYRHGLKGPLLDYVLKKYRGHRAIPQFVGNELVELEDGYKAQQASKLNAKLNACK